MSDLYPEILSLNANGLQTSAPDPHVSNNTDEHTLRNPDKNCFYNLAFDGSDCNGTPRPDIQANEEMAKTGTPASSECCSDALHGPDTPRHGGKQRMEALSRNSQSDITIRTISPVHDVTAHAEVTNARACDPARPVTDGATPGGDDESGDRETWSRKLDFLLSIIGFVVDLGNVWRFPYICYKNGGGTFLLPYLLMLVFLGLPLFYMELALGQYQRTGVISVWLRICPMFCGIGYGICIVSTLIGAYYNTIISWSVYFLIESFQSELPWSVCNQSWNTPQCVPVNYNGNVSNSSRSSTQEFFDRKLLEMDRSTGLGDLGSVKWSLSLCLFLVFLVIYFSLWRGIKQSGKVVWVTATAPYVILTILLIRGCTLPGAWEGIKYFLYPQLDHLLTTTIWTDAAAQIFFSLGPGFGVLLALSSYNKFNNNCFRDAVLTSSINCATSLLSGFVVFSVLGYMADLHHTTVDKVAADGPGLVFVVYPHAIATLAGSQFWAVIFFLMLITLGLDSSFGGLEALVTALCDQFPKLRAKRPLVLALQLSVCFLIGLTTVTYGGAYVVNWLDVHAAPTAVTFFCLVEVVAINWLYGFRRFASDIKSMLGSPPGMFIRVCWVFICPLALLVLLGATMHDYTSLTLGQYTYPGWATALGWSLTGASVTCVPGFMLYWFLTRHGTFKQRLLQMINPVSVPSHVS